MSLTGCYSYFCYRNCMMSSVYCSNALINGEEGLECHDEYYECLENEIHADNNTFCDNKFNECVNILCQPCVDEANECLESCGIEVM